jgi:hypothetical protein
MSENVWFRCKGCAQPASYFGAGLPPWYPPGSVGHSKPMDQLRPRGNAEPSRVKCALYQQLSAEAFWDLHREAERIEPPQEFKPVLG